MLARMLGPRVQHSRGLCAECCSRLCSLEAPQAAETGGHAEFCSPLSVPVVSPASAHRFRIIPSTLSLVPALPCPTLACEKLASLTFLCLKAPLSCPQVVLLVHHWSSRESEHDLLVHKAVARWTAEDVVLWLEQLGPWASLYRDRFLSERVNGR